QTSGTSRWLYGVSCTSASACAAVGDLGTVVATNDGSEWSAQTVSSPSGSDFDRLWGVSCAGATTCYAAGDRGALARTTDSGAKWSQVQAAPGTLAVFFHGVSCPSPSACFAAGKEERPF